MQHYAAETTLDEKVLVGRFLYRVSVPVGLIITWAHAGSAVTKLSKTRLPLPSCEQQEL